MIESFFLHSERLGFRRWTPTDRPLALILWGDPEVTRFFDARRQLTDAEALDRLRTEIATQNVDGVQYWPMFLLSSREFVGCCGLRPYDTQERVFEFGVHLRPTHWNKGLATESGRVVAAHAFEVLNVSALFAGHHPDNDRSRQMLTKLGFRYTHDEHYPPTGRDHPSYLLTRAAFERRAVEQKPC